MASIALLIVLLPLFAAVIGAVARYKYGDKTAQAITTLTVTVCAILSAFMYWHVAVMDAGIIEATLYNWIGTKNFSVDFGVLVDKLTATMFVVVTTVSAAVHWYSMGYMAEDKSKTRFFAYLSFFTFTMLALVSAPNLLQTFLGWEGVGVASYLLIGFWHQKESANAAAMKAFVVNRVADLALLLAMFIIFSLIGSLDYYDIFGAMPHMADATYNFLGFEFSTVGIIALLLFIGAMGKSAQLGFHTWLPDAMEGPTPVSALIHAATMVTAGVFLVTRMSPVFELSESVLTFVAWIGALTALFAATIGLTQKDIKRVIAYSTCSQLGYMFFACGVSAYPAAMFHLTTHAFFKALLFLGAGSVIHGMHHEQDMFKMGGIRKLLPVTYGLMWIGSLALAGIPPFAGFFSKDLILESAFMSHTETGQWLYLIGTIAAFLTAFYSFRLLYLTFHGQPRATKKVMDDAHESPHVMVIPMVVLAVGAVFGGLMFSGMGHLDWWSGAIMIAEGHVGLAEAHHIPKLFKFLPLSIALLGIVVATWFYLGKVDWPGKLAKTADMLYDLSYNKWYIDELYTLIFTRPLTWLSQAFWQVLDVRGIDRLGPNGAAWVAQYAGGVLRRYHTGYVYHYAFVFIVGLTLFLTWLIF